jgi:hypothetical protein
MAIRPIPVGSGTEMFFGKPAKPLSDDLVQRLRLLLAGMDTVQEAHLPQCYSMKLIDPPAQILVLVCDKGDQSRVTALLSSALADILPSGDHLDALVVHPKDKGILDAVRGCDCTLKSKSVRGKPGTFIEAIFRAVRRRS